MSSTNAIDLAGIADHLCEGEGGIWFSEASSTVSYPEEGNATVYALEEKSFWFQHRNYCIVEALRMFPPAGPIFDVGGGNGFVSLAIREAGFAAVVVESGPVGARHAAARGLRPVICSTLQDAGFRLGVVPAVGLFDVLEHIAEDRAFLQLLRRLMPASGRLYVTVPAYNFLWSTDDDRAQHYRRYTLSSLGASLESCGFALEFGSYFFALLPVPIFLLRALPSRLWRHTSEFARKQAEHRLPQGKMGRMLELLFRAELAVLRRKRRIPFGGSCLAVARAT
jgi:SAM-dependent methyltransferase